MVFLKKAFASFVLVSMAIAVFIQSCYGAPRPVIRPRRTRAWIRNQKVKHYKYVRSHDYNHDGKVDLKDRLRWINEHKASSGPKIYVSTENEDLVEVMDADGDGDVEYAEIELFYGIYDTNGNGVLEDAEIEAAE